MVCSPHADIPDSCRQQCAPERMPDLAPFTAGSFPLTAPTDGRRILQETYGKPEEASCLRMQRADVVLPVVLQLHRQMLSSCSEHAAGCRA